MDRLCHLYKEWLLPENYPLTLAGNIRKSEALLGMIFHKNLLSNQYQVIQMEQKVMYCGRKIMKKTALPVMKL
jgi:hypothetical protein